MSGFRLTQARLHCKHVIMHGPSLWPPLDFELAAGRLPLDHPPTLSGPWTAELRRSLGVLDPIPGPPVAGHPAITTLVAPTLPPEAYDLQIDPQGIRILASGLPGALQAAVTIKQLLPAAAWRQSARRRDDWSLPACRVQDGPALPYRGLMLDVARHFVALPELLRWVDLAAMQRLNHLHLHLSDDQGWRVELADFPDLVDIGSWRNQTWIGHGDYRPEGQDWYDRTPHGGYYTAADLAELAEYAAGCGITLVPEIDLPGHSSALLAAIPALRVPGAPVSEVRGEWGVFPDIVSPMPQAVDLLAQVLAGVASTVPSPYLHIGGDEVELGWWQRSAEVMAVAAHQGGLDGLRSQLIGELVAVVESLGRRPVVWDESYTAGGLPTSCMVMSWHDEEVGRAAARAGHDVVMTPVLPTYLDHAEAFTADEPVAIAAPITSRAAWSWVPRPAPVDAPGRVLGGQGQLWSEYLDNRAAREYRAFPRLMLLAGNLWAGRAVGAGDPGPAAQLALASQLDRLAARNVNFRPLGGPLAWQQPGTGRRAPYGMANREWAYAQVIEEPAGQRA